MRSGTLIKFNYIFVFNSTIFKLMELCFNTIQYKTLAPTQEYKKLCFIGQNAGIGQTIIE